MIKYNENIKNYEEKLKNTDSEKLRQETTKLIEKEKIKKSSVILSEGNFFKEYFNSLKN